MTSLFEIRVGSLCLFVVVAFLLALALAVAAVAVAAAAAVAPVAIQGRSMGRKALPSFPVRTGCSRIFFRVFSRPFFRLMLF